MDEPSAADVLRVAFQGERGAYSEQAALDLLGEGIELVPCATFDEVFACVEAGECEHGVVPVENSLAGSLHRVYDLLLQHDLYIVAEYNLRISHCLIAHPGVSLADIRQIYSHPMALAQCEESLRELGRNGIEIVAALDTAGSVKWIKEQGLLHAAAIAGERAAEIYGLAILRRELEDEAANYTRFINQGREADAHRREQDLAGLCRPKRAGAALSLPERLCPARHRPDQDRVAAVARRALGVCVLCRFPRQHVRGALSAGHRAPEGDGHLCARLWLLPPGAGRLGRGAVSVIKRTSAFPASKQLEENMA